MGEWGTTKPGSLLHVNLCVHNQMHPRPCMCLGAEISQAWRRERGMGVRWFLLRTLLHARFFAETASATSLCSSSPHASRRPAWLSFVPFLTPSSLSLSLSLFWHRWLWRASQHVRARPILLLEQRHLFPRRGTVCFVSRSLFWCLHYKRRACVRRVRGYWRCPATAAP